MADMNYTDKGVFIVNEEQEFVTIEENNPDFLSDAVVIDMSMDDLTDAITIDMSDNSDIFVSIDEDVIISDFIIDDYNSDFIDLDFSDDISIL